MIRFSYTNALNRPLSAGGCCIFVLLFFSWCIVEAFGLWPPTARKGGRACGTSNERANAAHAAKEQHAAASSSPRVGAFASCCTIRRGSYKCSAVKGKRCTRAKERRGGGLLFSIRRAFVHVVYICPYRAAVCFSSVEAVCFSSSYVCPSCRCACIASTRRAFVHIVHVVHIRAGCVDAAPPRRGVSLCCVVILFCARLFVSLQHVDISAYICRPPLAVVHIWK